jgi:hypothetical protein
MIHQPQAKQGSQSVEGVLADLEGQRARLLSAVTWVRGVADGVRAAIGSGQVEFTNTAYLTAQSVQAEIAISMPTPQGVKDVPAFTISCAVPPAEQATLLADEAATAVWLSKQVKGWLEWWFKAAPRIAYRPRKGLEVAFQGVKPIVAPGASQAAQRKP